MASLPTEDCETTDLVRQSELAKQRHREAVTYWQGVFSHRGPHPAGTIHFDFTEERHDRLFADTAENIAYGE